MPSQTFSAQDLRSAAVDAQRDKQKKTKWAFGQAWGPGRDAAHARPARPSIAEAPGYRRDGVAIASFKHQARASRKMDVSVEQEMSGDSSAEEEIVEASAAPEPDADVTYSYDAPRGPGHGSQILGLALAKAIERYEVRVVDKLVKDEYEVLDLDGESVGGSAHRKPKAPSAVDDEGFELV